MPRKASTTKPLIEIDMNPEQPIEPNENLMIEEFVSATEARQNAAIALLEARLEAMGDKFASQVRTMVERGLISARGKALREIQTIDVGFFLQASMETLTGNEQNTLEAATENAE